MNKTYLIFKHEFLYTIRRFGFIIMTLIVPILALLFIGIGKIVLNISKPQEVEIKTIGYVVEDGRFEQYPGPGNIELMPYENKDDAIRALISDDISEFFIVPSDYLSTNIIQRYTLEKEVSTPPLILYVIKNFLTSNLLAGKVPPKIIGLIESPVKLEVTRLDKTGSIASEQSGIGNIVMPIIFSMLLAFSLMFCANFLIEGLGEEKESRLIEVLLSSVSIRQLLIGKVLGLGAAGLSQVFFWLVTMPLLLKMASSTFGGFISSISLPPNFLYIGLIYFILGYLLFAVLSVGVGAVSPTARDGEQLALLYTLFGSFSPLWVMSLLFIFPNSPAWVILSIIPITAPVEMMLRLGIVDIPIWQFIVSIAVLIGSIIGGMFLSIKIFRTYLLMYGKKPTIKELIVNLRNVS
jgi:ABC-2 type transport system permease protein